ncbi:MAG: transglycosylase domain-containing protein [Deltaproteobacteria bacterium]|nr:transglycosylase domain-containing protein [Deltaproteobacteria bacterium]
MKSFFNLRGSREKGRMGNLLRFFLGFIAFSFIFMASFGFGAYFYIIGALPKLETLDDYRPNIVSTVYSDDEKAIGEFFLEKRVVVPYSRIPEVLINAFVAAEDGSFFEHSGISLVAILRAAVKNIEAGGVVQGGSTITQQVAKAMLLSPERKLLRKIKEAILAHRMEKKFSKEDILSLYLNHIYLGEGAYGVEAASITYFGKHVEEITLPEAALLAGLTSSPSRHSPVSHFDKAKERQVYVLERMVEDGYITADEEMGALNEILNIRKKEDINRPLAPYFTEHIRRYISEKYGDDVLYHDGLKIYTHLNIKMQESAERAVIEGVKEIDKRHGFRGPASMLKPEEAATFSMKLSEAIAKSPLEVGKDVEGVVEKVDNKGKFVSVRIGDIRAKLDFLEMEWAAPYIPKPGDLLLVQVKSLHPKTGEVRVTLDQEPEVQGALVAIDPYTGYVKALVGGYDYKKTEFNRVVQSRRQPGSSFKPIIYAAALDKGYTPASIIMDSPVIFEQDLEGQTWKPKNYDAVFHGPALGSSGDSLLELTSAYGVFAAQGDKADPVFITKIVDRDGKVLEENYPVVINVLSKGTAYVMTNLREGVVQSGTGQGVKALGRPAAGKTGTTNDLSDAWFMGYTPDLVAGTWVGYDQMKPLGKAETGGRAAAPIWLKFMQGAVAGTPVKGFPVPDDVVFVKIDKETGLLATAKSKETVFECFKEGTEPTEYSDPEAIQETDFFRYESGTESDDVEPVKPPEHEME